MFTRNTMVRTYMHVTYYAIFYYLFLEIASGICISIRQQMENIVSNTKVFKIIHHMSTIPLKKIHTYVIGNSR